MAVMKKGGRRNNCLPPARFRIILFSLDLSPEPLSRASCFVHAVTRLVSCNLYMPASFSRDIV